jgi:predicted nucleic-acid-binding Zn-ribbon protein
MAQEILPVQIQDLLNKISGLNRMFLAEKDRYVVVYCFDCGFRNFE